MRVQRLPVSIETDEIPNQLAKALLFIHSLDAATHRSPPLSAARDLALSWLFRHNPASLDHHSGGVDFLLLTAADADTRLVTRVLKSHGTDANVCFRKEGSLSMFL